MKRTYLVVFEKSNNCWSAFAPDIAGTGGIGDSFDEARQSIRKGIGYMLEGCVEFGFPLPEPNATSVDFAEFDPSPKDSHYVIEWLIIDGPEPTIQPRKSRTQAA